MYWVSMTGVFRNPRGLAISEGRLVIYAVLVTCDFQAFGRRTQAPVPHGSLPISVEGDLESER